MVATNLDALPASRELDALVAEEVMGLSVLGEAHCACPEGDWYVEGSAVDYSGDYGEIRPVYSQRCFCDKMKAQELSEFEPILVAGHRAVCLNVVPCYSTSIEAAWEVVEKLRGKIEQLHFLSNGAIEIIGWDGANEGYAFSVVADTAPLAICRAALKAVGAQSP